MGQWQCVGNVLAARGTDGQEGVRVLGGVSRCQGQKHVRLERLCQDERQSDGSILFDVRAVRFDSPVHAGNTGVKQDNVIKTFKCHAVGSFRFGFDYLPSSR